MSTYPERQWWDRDVDESGKPLRADVRESAHKVWKQVCAHARRVLGEDSDAAELLERAVQAISRYLNRNNVPLHSADRGGLLVLASYRSLLRLVRQRGRLDLVGGASDLAELLRTPDWRDEVERGLFLQQLVCELNARNRVILRLKMEGYKWAEIARIMQMTVAEVKNSFWRDVRRAHLRLQQRSQPGRSASSIDEGQ